MCLQPHPDFAICLNGTHQYKFSKSVLKKIWSNAIITHIASKCETYCMSALIGYVIMPFMVLATVMSFYNLYELLKTANLREKGNLTVILSLAFVACGCVWICYMIWEAYL